MIISYIVSLKLFLRDQLMNESNNFLKIYNYDYT